MEEQDPQVKVPPPGDTPRRLEAQRGAILMAEAEELEVDLGLVGLARGERVTLERSAALAVLGSELHLRQAAARWAFSAGDTHIQQGGAGWVLSGGNTNITQGGAKQVISAGNVRLEQGGALLVAGRQVTVDRGPAVLVIAGSYQGDGRPLVTNRGAAYLGLALGAAYLLGRLLLRR